MQIPRRSCVSMFAQDQLSVRPDMAGVVRCMVACSHAFDAFEFWTELNPNRDLRDDVIDFHRFQTFLMRSLRW